MTRPRKRHAKPGMPSPEELAALQEELAARGVRILRLIEERCPKVGGADGLEIGKARVRQ